MYAISLLRLHGVKAACGKYPPGETAGVQALSGASPGPCFHGNCIHKTDGGFDIFVAGRGKGVGILRVLFMVHSPEQVRENQGPLKGRQ